MSNIVSLSLVRVEREIKKIDIEASYTSMKTCLDMLNINNIEQLNVVKKELKKAMKAMEKLSKE